MKKQYQALIFVCRAQPLHNAHLATIEKASKMADKVIVVVGSANQPRDGDNPFNQYERIGVIREATQHIREFQSVPIECVWVENTVYNNTTWAVELAKAVQPHVEGMTNVKLIGHQKDDSTFYLNMFPQWGDPVLMPLIEILDATTIRNMYFSPKCNLNFFKQVCPPATVRFLDAFRQTEEYKYLCMEVEYIENYKKPYAGLPYPVSFNTGDAVVFKNGHVLLVKRKSQPGKGLLAFPGGFLNANTDKSLRDCAVRELYEETKIKLPEAVVRGAIREEKVFDAINRSRRGRIITTAQFIVLDSTEFPELPKVKGSDDAEKALWVPIHEVKREQMFEDHYDILMWFSGRVS